MQHIVTPSSPSNFRLRTLINFSEPKLTNVPRFSRYKSKLHILERKCLQEAVTCAR